MSYMHIDNLYANKVILQLRECYALEKVHGTSAHVACSIVDGVCSVRFFAGGVSHDSFTALFCEQALKEAFLGNGNSITVYGEAFGGKCQGFSHTYGSDLRFVAFDVKSGDYWLPVPTAEVVARKIGFDFVSWARVPTDLAALDIERDKPSSEAEKVGIYGKGREGVVLRPLDEGILYRGKRIIAKHKRPEFRETSTQRDPSKDADLHLIGEAVADEWVTEMRMSHVLDRLRANGIDATSLSATGMVIDAMADDIEREAGAEVEWAQSSKKAVRRRTAAMFKSSLEESIRT